MNNQITVVDLSNNQMNVDLISYFLNKNNNKKYVFFSKKETVQDGLNKMYVAVINEGKAQEISSTEWDELRTFMGNIINGLPVNIEYLSVNGNIAISFHRAIALQEEYVKSLINAYQKNISNSVMSNADFLNQSFGGSVNNETNKVKDELTISPIPKVDNVGDLEKKPANLDVNVNNNATLYSNDSFVPKIESINAEANQTVVNNSVPVNDFAVNGLSQGNVNELGSITNTNLNPLQSDFNVAGVSNSTYQTVFDKPNFGINQNEINNPNMDNVLDNKQNVVSVFSNQENVEINKDQVFKQENISNKEIDNDITLAKIKLNDEKINSLKKLIEIYEKENELLKRENNINKVNDFENKDLEHTASTLFNNSGILDEKVLEKTPDAFKIGGLAA